MDKSRIMGKSTRKLVPSAAFLLVSLALGTGCAKTGNMVSNNPLTYLSVINEANGTGAVTVFINDTLATGGGGIGAGTFFPRYTGIRPGTYDIKFKTAVTDSLLSEIPASVYDTLNFYTLLVFNVPGSGAVQSLKIWDDFSMISNSLSNYRFFNLCPDYPNVDLYFNSTLVQQGRVTADNVINTGFNSFQTVAGGPYTITAKVAGTDSVIVTASNQALSTGNAYTIFLSGKKGATSTTNQLQINVLQASY
jgi:uncharacterized protein DUF4397